eukprot:1724_1
MLDAAHCLIYHLNEISTENIYQQFKQNVQEVIYPIFSTGNFIDYISLKPLYQNLRNEITENMQHFIEIGNFKKELQQTKLILHPESTSAMTSLKASKTDEKYGIYKNEKIRIEHVVSILLYCNYSALCKTFRESFRKLNCDDTKDIIIQRHIDNFYWFGRFLVTAIEFWGDTPKKKQKFYHGTSCQFLFDQLSAVYETPTSTTCDFKVAQQFIGDGETGIVLHLAPKFKTDCNMSKWMNVSTVSDFPNEKERLFAGMTILSIINIYNPSDNKWDGYKEYIKIMLYFERIIEQNIHTKDFYNYGIVTEKTKKEWIELQDEYLMPLLQCQIQRKLITKKPPIPQYIYDVFTNICNKKTDSIDLSCIEYETKYMHPKLREIIFDDNNRIDNDAIKQIFPNLQQ